MAERIGRDLVLRGRVQGVFFRVFVRDEARRRGVAGRAVNAADGSVRVRLEGEPGAVAAVVEEQPFRRLPPPVRIRAAPTAPAAACACLAG